MAGASAEAAERACAAGECETAIDLLEQAVRAQPHDFRLHYRLGLCYGGCCRPHSLVHADMAVPYLRQALRLVGASSGADRAAILDQLGNTLVHGRSSSPAAALQAAIECHTEAAALYQALGMAEDWGRTEFNLGNSCCDLSETSGENRWEEAVSHYENSLRVRTREKDPERHAAVLENLGSARRRLTRGDAGDNIRKSIQCYWLALRIYTPEAHPDQSAALHNNLGNAFLSLPETDGNALARNARRALRHFDRALRIESRDRSSRAYGITQYNRAQAYQLLAQASPGGSLDITVTCLAEALAVFQSCGETGYTRLAEALRERIDRQLRENRTK